MVKKKNQARGRRAKLNGDRFENLISLSCKRYKQEGKAYIVKANPPFTVIGMAGNHMKGFYGKSGQPDFSGTLSNGQSIVFEAKFTSKPRIRFDAVKPHQTQALLQHEKLGAESFVIVGFKTGEVYQIDIKEWIRLTKEIGKKSMNHDDLEEYEVTSKSDLIEFIK